MSGTIKLNLNKITSEDFLQKLENLEYSGFSLWEGRILTDATSLKNYAYEHLIEIFQAIQSSKDPLPEQLDAMRSKLIALGSSENQELLSVEGVKDVFHTIINYAKGDFRNPQEILEGTSPDNDTENPPPGKILSPKWFVVAGVVGGIMLGAIAYYVRSQSVCIVPEGLNEENAESYRKIWRSTGDKKVLEMAEKLLKEIQERENALTFTGVLSRFRKWVFRVDEVGYNLPDLHARINTWLGDPAYSATALDLLYEIAKHDISNANSIGLVESGILTYAGSNDSALQLKALKALFALYERDGFHPAANLKFNSLFGNLHAIHKDNIGAVTKIIENINIKNDAVGIKDALIAWSQKSISNEYLDFSNLVFTKFFMDKSDINGSLSVIKTLIANSHSLRAYPLFKELLSTSSLSPEQKDQAAAVVQNAFDHSYFSPSEIDHLAQASHHLNNLNSLKIPQGALHKVAHGSLQECHSFYNYLMKTKNYEGLRSFGDMLKDKKTTYYVWPTEITELDKVKRAMAGDIHYTLLNL